MFGTFRRIRRYIYRKIPPIDISFLYTRVSQKPGKIPKQVFQTWVRPAVPLVLARQIIRFRRMNPGYSFFFYDDSRMAAYMDANYAGHPILKLFKEVHMPAEKADIWRYCVLYREGGIYCDIKSALKVPIHELLPEDYAELLSFEGNRWNGFLNLGHYADPTVFLPGPPDSIRQNLDYPDNIICNWFLCFEKGNPILREAIDLIVRHSEFYRGKPFEMVSVAGNHFTGPLALTQAVWASMQKTGKRPGQAGIDLHGQGIWRLPGMDYSHSTQHVTMRNLTLLD